MYVQVNISVMGQKVSKGEKKPTNTRSLSLKQRKSRKSGHKVVTPKEQTDPYCQKDEFVSGFLSSKKPAFEGIHVHTVEGEEQEIHALFKSLEHNFTALIDAYVTEYHIIQHGVEETRNRKSTRTVEIAF